VAIRVFLAGRQSIAVAAYCSHGWCPTTTTVVMASVVVVMRDERCWRENVGDRAVMSSSSLSLSVTIRSAACATVALLISLAGKLARHHTEQVSLFSFVRQL